MSLTQRLLIGSLVVISVFVVLTVAIVDRRVYRRSLEETVQQLAREGRIIAAHSFASTNFDSVARAAAASSGRRVTIIGGTGDVLGDSEIPAVALARLENQRSRPDVLAALDSNRVASASYDFGGQELLHVSTPFTGGVLRLSVPRTQPGSLSAGIRRDLILPGITALACALALAAFFAHSVSRPVVELRDVTRALADGDLTRRPPISAPGEVGELSRAVHTLSTQLASRLGALQDEDILLSALVDSLHEGVIAVDTRRQVMRINAAGRALLDLRLDTPFSTDLLPRHRLLREALADALAGRTTTGTEIEVDARRLALTARPLSGGGAVLALFDVTPIRRLEAVRRDFVANVSHELRTPLTIIGGFAETLSESDVPAAKRREFAELIRSNAARMQRLVDDLLDLSRIESGGWTPMPVHMQVEDAVRDCVAQFSGAAASKGLALNVAIDPDARDLWADPTAVRQILQNLVENALRHTTDGAITISSSVDRSGKGVRISVADSGVGIPQEHLPRIFERFYRVDRGRARDQGGTGLGLAIVRHMAEAHGGSVSATSVSGRGTTVTVLFPANQH